MNQLLLISIQLITQLKLIQSLLGNLSKNQQNIFTHWSKIQSMIFIFFLFFANQTKNNKNRIQLQKPYRPIKLKYNSQQSIINSSIMAKSQRKSSLQNLPSHHTKHQKFKKYVSTSLLTQRMLLRPQLIRRNFRQMINRLMSEESKIKKEIYMASFLNVIQSIEQVRSLSNLPSIENMISEQVIQQEEQDSCYSITEPLQSALLIAQPDLPVYFMSLLNKIFELIGMPLTKQQKQWVIKGTWNLIIKYWKDKDYQLYIINQKIQWGLLELLGFRLTTSKRQRFQAEELLRKTLQEIEKPHEEEIAPRSQISWRCTLQHIE